MFSTNKCRHVSIHFSKVFLAFLENLKAYIGSDMSPLWVNDTYYTHKYYKGSKILLNKLMTGKSPKQSHNQELRTRSASFAEFEEIMTDSAKTEFNKGVTNVNNLVNSMPEVPISTGGFKIPKFLES